ncbi:unnamed protein product, partial [Ectocarpus sp. 12 AP-2014]
LPLVTSRYPCPVRRPRPPQKNTSLAARLRKPSIGQSHINDRHLYPTHVRAAHVAQRSISLSPLPTGELRYRSLCAARSSYNTTMNSLQIYPRLLSLERRIVCCACL